MDQQLLHLQLHDSGSAPYLRMAGYAKFADHEEEQDPKYGQEETIEQGKINCNADIWDTHISDA
jgi:hypothetical protein